jgi:hypothetical protein
MEFDRLVMDNLKPFARPLGQSQWKARGLDMSEAKDGPGAETLEIVLPRDLLDGLDAHARTLRNNPSRGDVMQKILRDWLCEHGYVRAAGGSSGVRPKDLNSANDG